MHECEEEVREATLKAGPPHVFPWPRPSLPDTHICQERQPGHPLHGENQEGDHGQAPARGPFLNLPKRFSEGCIAAPATGKLCHLTSERDGAGGACTRWAGREHKGPTHDSFCRVRCW